MRNYRARMPRPQEKNAAGIATADQFFDERLFRDVMDLPSRALDPACGYGDFLIHALKGGSPALPGDPSGSDWAVPPDLSGGVKCQGLGLVGQSRAGVHWLRVTVPHVMVPGLVDALTGMCGEDFEFYEKYRRWVYDECYEWPGWSIRLHADSSRELAEKHHGGRATLEVPGSALDRMSGAELLQFMRVLDQRFVARCTRVDPYWDDYRRRIAPREIVADAEVSNFTGFRRWEHRAPRGLCPGGSIYCGDMLVFGRRGENGSGKVLRIYDKALESQGVEDCIRWEVEFSGDRARAVFACLAGCDDVEAMGRKCGELVGGSIDFLDRAGQPDERHLSRLGRLTWWQGIRLALGCCTVRVARRDRTIDSKREWVEVSVGRTLGTLREAMPTGEFDEWLAAVLDTGEGRMTKRDSKLAAEYRASQEVVRSGRSPGVDEPPISAAAWLAGEPPF